MLPTVRIECRKWPDDPHWEFDAVRLGSDRHGIWCGIATGTVLSRPGITMTAVADHVTLSPYDDWWLGTVTTSHTYRTQQAYVLTALEGTSTHHRHIIDTP